MLIYHFHTGKTVAGKGFQDYFLSLSLSLSLFPSLCSPLSLFPLSLCICVWWGPASSRGLKETEASKGRDIAETIVWIQGEFQGETGPQKTRQFQRVICPPRLPVIHIHMQTFAEDKGGNRSKKAHMIIWWPPIFWFQLGTTFSFYKGERYPCKLRPVFSDDPIPKSQVSQSLNGLQLHLFPEPLYPGFVFLNHSWTTNAFLALLPRVHDGCHNWRLVNELWWAGGLKREQRTFFPFCCFTGRTKQDLCGH